MEQSGIQETIRRLREELHHHNYLYYIKNAPEISDHEFDQKMKQLVQLEQLHPEFHDSNSPSSRVGSDLSQDFQPFRHKFPMLSLGNTYSEAELKDFVKRVEKQVGREVKFVCELKYDGTAVTLTYEHGNLVAGATRGDGFTGDNVTANVKTIKSIPLQLHGNFPELVEVRGEIFMSKNGFKQLNAAREKKKLPLFANPRNAAAGSLKLQNSSLVARRPLESFLYHVLGERLPSDSHLENLKAAESWGLKTSPHIQLCENFDEVIKFVHYWDGARKNLPYDIDGVVIKVNRLSLREKLGNTSKSPRWAISYKYSAETALTRLKSVDFQVGRTGAVTPVANLDPVLLAGTTVKRASLHNADIIAKLGLHLNDMVSVEKGGEIIPKITAVDITQRLLQSQPVEFIRNCPECDRELIRVEGEAAHYCRNETGCSPQILGKIIHFVSRKAMDIEGLGEETIELFYKKGLIEDVADLYTIPARKSEFLNLEDVKTEDKLGAPITSDIPVQRIIYSLKGAPALTKCTIIARKLLAAGFDFEALIDELRRKENFQEKDLTFLRSQYNRQFLSELIINSEQVSLIDFFTALKIPQLNPASINRLVNHYRYFYCLFKTDPNEIEKVGGMDYMTANRLYERLHSGEQKFERLNHLSLISIRDLTYNRMVRSLEKSRHEPFERVLFALGIRYVGETVAKNLASAFKSVENLRSATFEELLSVKDIGESIAGSVIEYFSDHRNLKRISRLEKYGLQFALSETDHVNQSNKLDGMNFVISGSFETPQRRKELKTLVEANGGKVTDSVSKNTNFLLAGDHAGPDKLKKAETYQISILNEQDFLNLIES